MVRLTPLENTNLPEDRRHLVEQQSAQPPEEYRHLAAEGDLNIFYTLAHNPTVLSSFRHVLNDLWDGTGLSAVQRELVILAVVREYETEYVWHHHVRGALTIGVTPETIVSLSAGDYAPLEPPDAALCRYSVAVVTGDVSDEHWAEVTRFFDESALVGATVLAGLYVMVARFLDAFDTELEVPFVGWNLENV